MNPKIREDLIYRDLDFSSAEETIRYLATKLYEKEIVVEGYIESVIAREKVYPTGLPAKINIAIPHTDSDYVREPSIAIGILNNPVEFNSMENPDNKLEVKLVIMLAIKEPDNQISLLQSVVSLIQNEEDVLEIINSSDKNNVKQVLKKYI